MLIGQVMIFFPVIKDWSARDSHSHLKGGMMYEDGKLIVPKAFTHSSSLSLQEECRYL